MNYLVKFIVKTFCHFKISFYLCIRFPKTVGRRQKQNRSLINFHTRFFNRQAVYKESVSDDFRLGRGFKPLIWNRQSSIHIYNILVPVQFKNIKEKIDSWIGAVWGSPYFSGVLFGFLHYLFLLTQKGIGNSSRHITNIQRRVWSWLRMNASDRPNTCKSRGSTSSDGGDRRTGE